MFNKPHNKNVKRLIKPPLFEKDVKKRYLCTF